MRANQLVLRCYAERTGDLWNAYCLDLSLGTQADSFDEAKKKLDLQIGEYVRDAFAGGQDQAHGVYLLTRKAPFSMWLKYWGMKALIHLVGKKHPLENRRRFKEVMPLSPAHCH